MHCAASRGQFVAARLIAILTKAQRAVFAEQGRLLQPAPNHFDEISHYPILPV